MDMTVLISCKNRLKNLKYCLESINSCKNTPRTIVVDFGSTVPISNEVSYPWLKIIRVERKTKFFHKARALNIGIRRIKTKYLCITDADQIFAPNFFNVVYNKVTKYNRAFVMCHTFFIKHIPEDVTPNNIAKNYKRLLRIVSKKTKVPEKGDGCCNGLITKWAKNVRGYDEGYLGYGAEDSDFALRAFMAGFKRLWIHKETTMIHLPHPKCGKYYDKKLFLKNRGRYYARKNNKDVVVNKGIAWGKL